jgi:hypothetical protein
MPAATCLVSSSPFLALLTRDLIKSCTVPPAFLMSWAVTVVAPFRPIARSTTASAREVGGWLSGAAASRRNRGPKNTFSVAKSDWRPFLFLTELLLHENPRRCINSEVMADDPFALVPDELLSTMALPSPAAATSAARFWTCDRCFERFPESSYKELVRTEWNGCGEEFACTSCARKEIREAEPHPDFCIFEPVGCSSGRSGPTPKRQRIHEKASTPYVV